MSQHANIERVDNGWIVHYGILSKCEVFLELESALVCVANEVKDYTFDSGRIEEVVLRLRNKK